MTKFAAKNVYDGLGRVVSTLTGTSSGNLVDTADTVYDGYTSGVGDGNVTKVTRHPGGTLPDRVDQTWYDWRDRVVAAKQSVSASENDNVGRPLSVSTYDNLDEVVMSQRYNGDGVTPVISGGVLQTSSIPAAALRAQSASLFDELGRTYQTQQYSVDPTTGTPSTNTLKSDTYTDIRGNVIASSSPGGEWTKSVIDSSGRTTNSYVTDGAGSYSTITGDHVISETDTTFDANSNVILTASSERYDTVKWSSDFM